MELLNCHMSKTEEEMLVAEIFEILYNLYGQCCKNLVKCTKISSKQIEKVLHLYDKLNFITKELMDIKK